ncbi:hypothetical protein DFP72DRAFT_841682 [Ephemerocybe angulata]|uniref:Uncharacterized protein n=1 Tax=Ephemerocybe angulata TaxID=980116 RepID=A0A8H6IET9_9AGAR|nr:hypothetical protein DFP72DRAFT_841682 [Tulosesus angulatus]
MSDLPGLPILNIASPVLVAAQSMSDGAGCLSPSALLSFPIPYAFLVKTEVMKGVKDGRGQVPMDVDADVDEQEGVSRFSDSTLADITTSTPKASRIDSNLMVRPGFNISPLPSLFQSIPVPSPPD